jgi:two-component system, response regulator PdtaR
MSQSLRVVLAEDERDTREYLQELLTRLGHQVVAAENGKQLAELCLKLDPELVVTDIKMPDMDGITAAELVTQKKEVPVILISAHHDAELLARSGADHIMGYLIKPVKPPDVEVAISVAMARFAQFQAIRKEARDLRQALDDRKVIERAKGAVMRRLGLGEDEAFRRVRRLANDQNRKVVEIAQEILAANEVFQRLEGR